jgi:hypothetical protein
VSGLFGTDAREIFVGVVQEKTYGCEVRLLEKAEL